MHREDCERDTNNEKQSGKEEEQDNEKKDTIIVEDNIIAERTNHGSPNTTADTILFEDIIKFLTAISHGENYVKEKFSWLGSYETLQDLVSIVIKKTRSWSERIQGNATESSRVMAHVFKSQNLTFTWYVNTKTLQLQGSDSEQICLQLSKLVKQYAKKQGHSRLQGPITAKNDNGPAMASACDKPGSIMDSSMQNKKHGYQNDEGCYSFKSESEYDYTFIDKDYYFGNPDQHNISNDSRSHFSWCRPDDIHDDHRKEFSNIWSAINILYSRNSETGKFYMSTITEEREKSKELQDKLMKKLSKLND